MGFFRSRKSSSQPSGLLVVQSWKIRINPFSRSSSRQSVAAVQPIQAVPLTVVVPVQQYSLQRANTTSTTFSQTSTLPSRAPSLVSTTTAPSPTTSTYSPIGLKRSPSIYSNHSHRSMSIRRDSLRGPPPLPRLRTTSFGGAPLITMVENDNSTLVLTSTSQYPTGVAAELYIPEDCTYKTIMERQKEHRRNDFRGSMKSNTTLIRRNSGIHSAEEKKRLKRVSINF